MALSTAAKARAWLLDYVFAASWQVRSLRPVATPGPGHGGGRTVVLLPGIWESARFLRPLARDLAARGHRVHEIPALGWNGAPVEPSARLVAAELARLDLRDVVLVAHSKGGLIGKYVMTLLDEDRRVASMVAIATPFHGSRFAPYLVLASLRAFSPADPTTLLLGEHTEVDERITSIWGAFDPHIPGGSRLSGASNVMLPLGGHFRILGSPLLRDEVHRALERNGRAAGTTRRQGADRTRTLEQRGAAAGTCRTARVASATVTERFEYGDGPMQYAVLHPADGDAVGTIVLIHGGFWRGTPDYFDGPTALAQTLVASGWHVWQLEYRQLPNGGGFPQTLDDVAAGIERLGAVAEQRGLDLGPVVTVGHSAGGHLAVWALSRPDAVLPLTGAVSLAGVLNLRLGDREGIGEGAVTDFLGGTSSEYPDRYDAADPIARVDPRLPVRIVHGDQDDVVPMNQSDTYVAEAQEAGQDAAVAVVAGDHMVVIDPAHPAFDALTTALDEIRATV